MSIEDIRRLAAERKARTHCPQGHEYTPENTDVYGNERRCKTCRRASQRRSYRRTSAWFRLYRLGLATSSERPMNRRAVALEARLRSLNLK